MDTEPKGKNKKEAVRKARKIERLSEDTQVKRLLRYYDLSLTEGMTPTFGVEQQFPLAIYNEKGEQVETMAPPTLDFLSQDLGFVEEAGFSFYKSLDLPNDKVRKDLFNISFQRGKASLNKYLQHLRPILMEDKGIYFYAMPVSFVKTEEGTGHFKRAEGKRVLCALPMSTHVAAQYGCSDERIRELAPQVAWLIPMLVVYRKVKNTEQLKIYLDGWRALCTNQQNERIHTMVTKHAPSIIDTQISQLLLF
jgi:hypothetical protein